MARFTSDSKEQFGGVSGVTITTFTMVAFSGKRSEESEKVILARDTCRVLVGEVTLKLLGNILVRAVIDFSREKLDRSMQVTAHECVRMTL